MYLLSLKGTGPHPFTIFKGIGTAPNRLFKSKTNKYSLLIFSYYPYACESQDYDSVTVMVKLINNRSTSSFLFLKK